jgi:hypothetical protein
VSFELRAQGVEVDRVMAEIRQRIEAKKAQLYTEAEIREIAERPLEPLPDAHDVRSGLLAEFRLRDASWNFAFDAETLYRSSRGRTGRILRRVRALLQPVQKLFWNPNPMISALSRQADLNRYYVHLLHNLVEEMTRLNLELQEQKSRSLELVARLEMLARREKTLEALVVPAGSEGPAPPEG